MRRWSIAAVAALALAAPEARSEERPADRKPAAEAVPAKPKEKKAKPEAKKQAAVPAEKKADEKPCQPVAPCTID